MLIYECASGQCVHVGTKHLPLYQSCSNPGPPDFCHPNFQQRDSTGKITEALLLSRTKISRTSLFVVLLYELIFTCRISPPQVLSVVGIGLEVSSFPLKYFSNSPDASIFPNHNSESKAWSPDAQVGTLPLSQIPALNR